MPPNRNRLVDPRQGGTGGGNRRIGLPHAAPRFQAVALPLRHQFLAGRPNFQCAFLDHPFIIQAGQIGIRIANAGGECQPRLLRVKARGVRFRRRRSERSPIAAPEIKVEIEVQRHLTGAKPPLGHEILWEAHIIALLRRGGRCVEIERRR